MATYYCYNCEDEGERLHVDATVSADRVYAHCPACRQYRLHRPVDGEAAKVAGIAQALANPTDAPWRVVANECIARLAASGVEFTSEDVTREVGVPPSGASVGAILNNAARSGRIVRTGYVNARRVNQHSALISVWRGKAA